MSLRSLHRAGGVTEELALLAPYKEACAAARPLPAAYHRLFRCWFAFGFPAFGAVLAIFWLMLARP